MKFPIWHHAVKGRPRILATNIMMRVLLVCLRWCYEKEDRLTTCIANTSSKHDKAVSKMLNYFIDFVSYARELSDCVEETKVSAVPLDIDTLNITSGKLQLADTFIVGINFITHFLMWNTKLSGSLHRYKMFFVRANGVTKETGWPSQKVPSQLDTCVTYLLLHCPYQEVRNYIKKAIERIAWESALCNESVNSRKGVIMTWIRIIVLSKLNTCRPHCQEYLQLLTALIELDIKSGTPDSYVIFQPLY
jgi:hypothetical protein